MFNNDSVDGSFGVTSRLFLREITPFGRTEDVIPVPSSELNTSFSSKSEGALNLSSDGKYVTFIDYVARPDTVDVSNANTPGVVDPTNPVPGAYYRAVAQLSADGKFTFTETNAYSGNNGRAAVEAKVNGKYYIYTAGNAGNGSNPQPDGVILGAGAQIITPSSQPEADQTPGTPTPVGSFSVTELGDKADKVGKDDNFRGLTLLQQRALLHQGQRRQRRRHRVLPRHHRHRLPERRGAARAWRAAADHAGCPTTWPPCRPAACPATCAS